MVSQSQQRILHRLYTTPNEANSFGGLESLYKRAKPKDDTITRKIVKQFLQGEESYTLHRNTYKRFPRRRVISPRPKFIISCDLADMRSLSNYNSNFKYILVVIDIFSRFLQVCPLKKKDGITVLNGLKSIIDSGEFNGIKKMNSDSGREFYNRHMYNYLQTNDIVLYSVHSKEIKASIAERVIRTLKAKLYRYMSHMNTLKYLDVLQDIVNSYNNSPHRGLGLGQTPAQVHTLTYDNEIKIQFNRMYKRDVHTSNRSSSSLAVGQAVRIADSERNAVFRRGFTIQNTVEIFKVREVDKKYYPTVYYLEDLQGEAIEGIFYREELTPCSVPEFYSIDVIKTKTVKGRKKYFVKWRGYPEEFNSWIDESRIARI